jgi:hypothetical protein
MWCLLFPLIIYGTKYHSKMPSEENKNLVPFFSPWSIAANGYSVISANFSAVYAFALRLPLLSFLLVFHAFYH